MGHDVEQALSRCGNYHFPWVHLRTYCCAESIAWGPNIPNRQFLGLERNFLLGRVPHWSHANCTKGPQLRQYITCLLPSCLYKFGVSAYVEDHCRISMWDRRHPTTIPNTRPLARPSLISAEMKSLPNRSVSPSRCFPLPSDPHFVV